MKVFSDPSCVRTKDYKSLFDDSNSYVILILLYNAVILHKNGIEFRSATPFAPWTEMTMSLQSARDDGRVNCTGVVICCSGSKHTGYHVSMVFTGLSKQAQARLSLMAYLEPAW